MAETPPSTTTTADTMDFTVFMETNIGTKLVMVVHHHDTVRDLKRKFMIEHALSIPNIGEIKVSAIKMKHDAQFYHLSELMLVAKAFYGCEGSPCLHVDATLACAHNDPETGISADSLIGHDKHTQQERIPVRTNDPSFHPTTTPLVKVDKMIDACLMQNEVCNQASGRMAENPNPKLDYTVVPEEVSKQMNEKVQEDPSGSKGENVAAATVFPDHPAVIKSKGSVHAKKKKKRHDSDGKVRCVSGNHPEIKDEVSRDSKGKSKLTDPSFQNSSNNIAIHRKKQGQKPSLVIHSTIVADTSDGRSWQKKKKISKTDAGEGYRIVVRQAPSKKLELLQISARDRAFTRGDPDFDEGRGSVNYN